MGLSNQGQYFIGWTPLLWCAKDIKFWTVKQHKVQPRSGSLIGPVRYSTLVIWFSEAKLLGRFLHVPDLSTADSHTDREKSVYPCRKSSTLALFHGPWRIFQHRVTALVLCLTPPGTGSLSFSSAIPQQCSRSSNSGAEGFCASASSRAQSEATLPIPTLQEFSWTSFKFRIF